MHHEAHQADDEFLQAALGFRGCLRTRHFARPAKGNERYRQSQQFHIREVGTRKRGPQVHCGLLQRDLQRQEDCCDAFSGATLARFTERDVGTVTARNCWGQRFTCGHSWVSCGRGRRCSGGGAFQREFTGHGDAYVEESAWHTE